MKIKTLVFLLIALIFLSGCSQLTSNTSSTVATDVKEHSVIDETAHYKIIYSNSTYSYYIYDKNHNVVKAEELLNKKPELTMVNENIVKFTMQAGTGIGTQWGYFYDAANDVFSPIYYSIYAQTNDKVAYGGVNKVIVSDIFDKENYYCEITEFKEPLSKTVQPIFGAEFIDEGNKLKVSYLSGDSYVEADEVFDLE